jgi:excinuclease ABC subunit C
MARMAASEKLQETINSLPAKPGVYLMKDGRDNVIYVGKAINLRSRVRSYFHDSVSHPKQIRLAREIEAIDFIVTGSELEALILEMNLIKRHRPKYNIRLKDDKRYPYIKVHWQLDYPKVTVTRRMDLDDGSRYFGPYTSAWAVHQTLDLLRKTFPYLTCNRQITGKDERACLYYDIRLCGGPCIGAVSREEYRATIQGLMDFLNGRSEQVIVDLKARMAAAAQDLDFEKAAQIRDQLEALGRVVEKQKVVSLTRTDQDVIAFARQDDDACAQVFFIRGGKLIGREYFVLDGTEDEEPQAIMTEFVKQFYDEAAYVPPEVLLPDQVPEANVIERWLAERRGNKVTLKVPRRGRKRELIQMAAENATETLTMLRAQWEADRSKHVEALSELQEALELPVAPARIECYDISTTQGKATTGSMVVFVQGAPYKRDYRRFSLRGLDRPDDYEAMRQVLARRFRRWQETQEDDRPDTAWAVLPDLLLVDGGKGQLGVAVEVLNEFSLLDRVPLAGLAKRREELFLPGRMEAILLPRRSQGLYLVQRVRDEAHRFAVSYHRQRRGKTGLASTLDAVPGVGPRRRTALLQAFGSIQKIQKASVDEIAAVPGIPRHVAEALKEQLG